MEKPKREFSPAQQKAAQKYDEKFDYVRARLPKGTADRIRALGYSFNAFVSEATLERLNSMGTEYKKEK